MRWSTVWKYPCNLLHSIKCKTVLEYKLHKILLVCTPKFLFFDDVHATDWVFVEGEAGCASRLAHISECSTQDQAVQVRVSFLFSRMQSASECPFLFHLLSLCPPRWNRSAWIVSLSSRTHKIAHGFAHNMTSPSSFCIESVLIPNLIYHCSNLTQ